MFALKCFSKRASFQIELRLIVEDKKSRAVQKFCFECFSSFDQIKNFRLRLNFLDAAADVAAAALTFQGCQPKTCGTYYKQPLP